MRHAERLRRAAEGAEAAGLAAVLVTPSADLIYLLGYDPPPLERLTCLVIRPRRNPVLLVPALERPLAETHGSSSLAEIVSWREDEDPYALVASLVGEGGRIACSDRMWASHLLAIQRTLPEPDVASASTVIGPLRARKDEDELHLLKRAARAADESFHRIIEDRLEGLTEKQVAERLGDLLLRLGHDEVGFTIVGSGPNGASPHHDPGDRGVRAGDGIVLDFGGSLAGYRSDLSRTVAVAEVASELEEAHEVVREAQERAFRAVRPGLLASEVDRAAREVIEQAGYGERFIHRTGHGIGLEEHESPYLVAGNEDPLLPGMCFSIEPGIYLEGRFGVRIEDIVTVTESGAVRLNHAPRELRVTR